MLLEQTEQEGALAHSHRDMYKQTWLMMGVYSTEIV